MAPSARAVGIKESGTVLSRVTLNGVDFTDSYLHYSYITAPLIESMSPTKGPTTGDTLVTIYGTHFILEADKPLCKFGSSSVPAVILSKTVIQCSSPPRSNEGVRVPVQISLNDGADWYYSDSAHFEYYLSTKVTAVNPTNGLFNGGTAVRVHGSNFVDSQHLACKFGKMQSSTVTWISTHQVICISPQSLPGKVFVSVTSNGFDYSPDKVLFEYIGLPDVKDIFPSRGGRAGGTIVSIRGKNFKFSENLVCRFGTISIVPAAFVNQHEINCVTPRAITKGYDQVPLHVSNNGFDFSRSKANFVYVDNPSLSSLNPTFGYHSSTNVIEVKGENLSSTESAWCKFTHVFSSEVSIVEADIIDVGTLKCKALEKAYIATVFIEVSTNWVDWSSNGLQFDYLPGPTISQIYPLHGSYKGGTDVTISGTSFSQKDVKMQCAFGPATILAVWYSTKELHCLTPQSAKPELVPFSLLLNNSSRIKTGFNFKYLAPITLSTLSPNVGSVSGRQIVVVLGTNFIDSNDLLCDFDMVTVPARYITSDMLECISPPHPPGNVNMKIYLRGDSNVEVRDVYQSLPFTYKVDVAIESVFPDLGPVGGNTKITLTGIHFVDSPLLGCRFSDINVKAQFISPFELQCSSPPFLTAASIPISVTSDGIYFTEENMYFQYTEEPFVLSVSPASISVEGESTILVSGSSFHQSSGLVCVYTENSILSQARWLSSKLLSCDISASLAFKSIPISVSNNFGYNISPALELEITPIINVFQVSPASGPLIGGTRVTIFAKGWKHTSESICKFGTIQVPAELTSKPDQFECRAPYYDVGEVNLQISPNSSYFVGAGTFIYYESPIIEHISPEFGPISGGTPITISGKNFLGVTICRFGALHLGPAFVESGNKMVCFAPVNEASLEEEKSVILDVSPNKHDFSNGVTFAFKLEMDLLSLTPPTGIDLGGTVVNIHGRFFYNTPMLSCRFGTSVVEAHYLSPSIISCATPIHPIGLYKVSVSGNGIDFSKDSLRFQFHAPCLIHSIVPRAGPVVGGTQVLIFATNLVWSESLGCRFGTTFVPASFQNNALLCVSPRVETRKTTSISITLNGQDYSNADGASFKYFETSQVITIEPEGGWKSGGIEVILTVSNLFIDHSIKMYCVFDNEYIEAYVVSKKSIGCVVPAMEESTSPTGKSRVSIAYEGSLDSLRPSGPYYTYISGAVVSRISPTLGSLHGGTLVHVYGDGFYSASELRCNFVGVASVEAYYITEHYITCISPPYNVTCVEAKLEVTSLTGAVETISTSAEFQYILPHSINSLYPTSGSRRGGTIVSIYGKGFSGGDPEQILCRFGLASYTSRGEIVHDNLVKCKSPQRSDTDLINDMVSVSISLNDGHDYISGDGPGFKYIEPLHILSLSPHHGSIIGGTTIRVATHGLDRRRMQNIQCHFGGLDPIAALNVFDQPYDESVYCTSPPLSTLSKQASLMLELSVNGGNDKTASLRTFTYYETPVVEKVNPVFGSVLGGNKITVSGAGFLKFNTLGCLFGAMPSLKVKWISQHQIVCVSPPADIDDTMEPSVILKISNNGFDYFPGSTLFQYISTPSLKSVWPTNVSTNGGTKVKMDGKCTPEKK